VRITGIAYININCTNLARSKSFYLALGCEVETEFAEGFFPRVDEGYQVGPHRLRASLLRLGSGPGQTQIDLIEWVEPHTPAAPSAALTKPGFQRIAFATADFDGDYQRLLAMGVQFLSEPMTIEGPEGAEPVFVCFRDPDGNVLELVPRKAET
jgi:catechol 2,3-dioxygenase-like lactoylglutathione lyase family enzyme